MEHPEHVPACPIVYTGAAIAFATEAKAIEAQAAYGGRIEPEHYDTPCWTLYLNAYEAGLYALRHGEPTDWEDTGSFAELIAERPEHG